MSYDITSLLTTRRFLPMFVTQFLQAFNDNVFLKALLILIAYQQLTLGSINAVILTTIISSSFIIPYIIFSAFAGEVADKMDKALLTRAIKVIELVAVCTMSLGLMQNRIWLMLAGIVTLGIHSAFFCPIKYSILPQHLKAEELLTGNALIEGGTFTGILLGSCVGSYFISVDHYGTAIIACLGVLTSILGLISSFFIPSAQPLERNLKISYHFIQDSFSLIRYVTERPKIYLTILGLSWFWFVGYLFMTELPAFTHDILHAKPSIASLLTGLCSLGIMVGSLICNRLQKGRITATYVPIGIIGLSIFLIDLFFASHHYVYPPPDSLIGMKAFLMSLSNWRIMLDVFLINVAGGIYTVPLYTLLQYHADADHCSRIVGANNIFNSLFMVAAVTLSATLSTISVDIPKHFLLLGIVNGTVAVIIFRLLPETLVKSFVCWLLNLFYRVKITGLENYIAAGERVVIVANHVSFLDGLLLSAFLPDKLLFTVHTHVARQWWMQPILHLTDSFPLNATNPMQLKSLVKAIKEKNRRCLIFPEGRITVTGSLMKIYEGPTWVANKSDSAILPIRIDGAQYSIFSRIKNIVPIKFFPKITINILPPQKFIIEPNVSARERRRQLGDKLYHLMSDLMFNTSNLDQTLFDSLLQAKQLYGGNHIIIEDINRYPLTYQQLFNRIYVLSTYFHRHLSAEKYIGVLLPNTTATVVTIFALYARGKIPAILNYSTGSRYLQYYCEVCQIKTLLTSRQFVERLQIQDSIERLMSLGVKVVYLEDIKNQIGVFTKILGYTYSSFPQFSYRRFHPQAKPEDTAVILFTSGSEGTPKGVALSHRNINANRYQVLSRVSINPKDVLFNALPMFHAMGFNAGTMMPMFSGVKTFLYPSPLHYRVIPELVYDTDATILFATDTFLYGYARYAHPYDFYSIQLVFGGAEKLRAETRALWSEKFGHRILEGYGTTEAAPVLALNTPMHNKLYSTGKFMPGIEYRLEPVSGVTEGQRLWVRGPNIMQGYVTHQEPGVIQNLVDGWYDTGDIVRIDENGYIHIVDRAKRFAKVGGEMVPLSQVENYINECWHGYLHAVIGKAAPGKGEQLILATTYPEAKRSLLLQAFRKRGIAEIFLPKQYVVLRSMPLLGSGKIDYQQLSQILEINTSVETSVSHQS